jgi:hypothetical protein
MVPTAMALVSLPGNTTRRFQIVPVGTGVRLVEFGAAPVPKSLMIMLNTWIQMAHCCRLAV